MVWKLTLCFPLLELHATTIQSTILHSSLSLFTLEEHKYEIQEG